MTSSNLLIITPENVRQASRALYWYCDKWHTGQWSLLHRIMRALRYRPDLLETGPVLGCKFDDALYMHTVTAKDMLEGINVVLDNMPV